MASLATAISDDSNRALRLNRQHMFGQAREQYLAQIN